MSLGRQISYGALGRNLFKKALIDMVRNRFIVDINVEGRDLLKGRGL